MKKIIHFFASEKRQTGLVYAWILAICFLSYGVLIPALGFYWDDFPILFLYKTFGAGGFPEFLASDRPFSAWNFMLTTSLFKFNPLGYHLLAFALRYLSVMLFYWIFRTVWPERRKIAAVAASIFAIYPGFHQQPIALIYCHHFSVFDLFLLSVLLMLQNAKREKFSWGLAAISWIGALGMFSIENFATLEILRPLLLWIILKPKYEDYKALLKAILKQWLPYLLIFGAFMFWRVFIFKFPTYEPDLLEGLPVQPNFHSGNSIQPHSQGLHHRHRKSLAGFFQHSQGQRFRQISHLPVLGADRGRRAGIGAFPDPAGQRIYPSKSPHKRSTCGNGSS